MGLHAVDEVGDDMLAVRRGRADQVLAFERGVARIGQGHPVEEKRIAIVLAVRAEARGMQVFAQDIDGLVVGQLARFDLML